MFGKILKALFHGKRGKGGSGQVKSSLANVLLMSKELPSANPETQETDSPGTKAHRTHISNPSQRILTASDLDRIGKEQTAGKFENLKELLGECFDKYQPINRETAQNLISLVYLLSCEYEDAKRSEARTELISKGGDDKRENLILKVSNEAFGEVAGKPIAKKLITIIEVFIEGPLRSLNETEHKDNLNILYTIFE